MTLQEIWAAIDAGKQVYWLSRQYPVTAVKSTDSEFAKYSERNGQCLRIADGDPAFGGFLGPKDSAYCEVVQ